jgi:hypothetical protein
MAINQSVDDGLLYVLDSGNRELKVLTTSRLELVDIVLSDELREFDPRRISFDVVNKQLAVAVEDGRILLFSFS